MFQIFFSDAEILHYKRCFEDMLGVAQSKTGVHPKMGKILRDIFGRVEDVGGDIGREKRRRTGSRTWKDSTQNTLFMD
ncbi:hypothetical protein BDZ89DRAFT_955967 [Hymenopellis radicata]|nr:hypothetical protein CPB85DRAFT_1231668 [Mucidula mucida]KAF8906433.1 hypothetical protein CPB85DRAFT_1224048 [Mucidula mucida]KAF9023083.1 hypothetical protein BDZ89DRAFT_955967 [Hymenopellis radicata]